MEILFVSHKHPPTTGGMEKQSYELISKMKSLCTVHQLVYKGVGSKFLFFLRLQKAIRKICDQHPAIAIIHFNDALIASFYQLFLAKEKNNQIKYAVTLHGLDVVYPSQLYRKFIFPRLNHFDLIVAVSKATAQKAHSLGIDPCKVKVIPNGVDENIASHTCSWTFHDDFQRKHHFDLREKQILVAVGRPVTRKGFSWFIRHVLPKLDASYLLLIVGPFHWKKTRTEKVLSLLPTFLSKKITLFFGLPDDEPPLRQLLNDPLFRRRVKHLGRLPFTEILDILNHGTGFVMPNIAVPGDMEGFGLVCLEASLCGTAVFASEIDGITEAVANEKNGFLIPAQDEAEWAEKLNKWLRDPTSKERMTHFKTYTLHNYSWTKMAAAYYQTFCQLNGEQDILKAISSSN